MGADKLTMPLLALPYLLCFPVPVFSPVHKRQESGKAGGWWAYLLRAAGDGAVPSFVPHSRCWHGEGRNSRDKSTCPSLFGVRSLPSSTISTARLPVLMPS